MSSVEESARSAMENLISELEKEREVSDKQRVLNEKLIAKLTRNEEEKTTLIHTVQDLEQQISDLKQLIAQSSQKKEETVSEPSSKDTTENTNESVDAVGDIVVDIPDPAVMGETKKDDINDDAGSVVVSSQDILTFLSKPMDARRRFLIQVIMIIRFTFRGYFGLSFANRWGFYVDRHMSKKIRDFGNWMQYPKGDKVLEGHTDLVRAAEVSRDGYYLYTAGVDKVIKVWDMSDDDKLIRELTGHTDAIRALSYRLGLLASASGDTTIRIWNRYKNYTLMNELKGHTKAVWAIQFNEKGTRIVSGSDDYSVCYWDVKSGECLRVLNGHTGSIKSIALIDRMVISGSEHKCIKVWDLSNSGKECHSITDGIFGRVFNLSVNSNSTLIAATFISGFRVYHWPSMEFVSCIEHRANRGVFHPSNPDILALSTSYGLPKYNIGIYNIRNGECLQTFGGHSDQINCVRFSPDGGRLISVSSDHSVRIYSVIAW